MPDSSKKQSEKVEEQKMTVQLSQMTIADYSWDDKGNKNVLPCTNAASAQSTQNLLKLSVHFLKIEP